MSRARTQTPSTNAKATPRIRCAIYTRKSSEEGLSQEFNSLDAQRESAEAYIASQKSGGWVALPDRYDDGGFSGGNMDRPAMERLMADIEAGKIDCVVVYKVDRLSRSLMDFARIMEVFERRQISFVSVTQHFNTTHSMGRLTLNILLSFAQFEREIIGERIRDKIAAQRRKGKWAGGVPVLGYDVDRSGSSPRLVVNATEASRVRQIFDLYLQRGSLLPTIQELARRGWYNKRRNTKAGKTVGGKVFDRTSLHALLTNPIYVGKIVHKSDTYDGEHPPIVAAATFKKVCDLLQRNRHSGSAEVRNRYGALLRGILHCKCCNRTMVHTFAGKVGKKGQQYRYYTCTNSIKRGRSECPAGSLPAAEIERFVVDQVRAVADDPKLKAEILSEARTQSEREIAILERERADLERAMTRHNAELRKLAISGASDNLTTTRIAELHEKIQLAERRVAVIAEEITKLHGNQLRLPEVSASLEDFDGVWSRLSPREQARLIALLVDQVDYDAQQRTVAVKFHATGISNLSTDALEEAA